MAYVVSTLQMSQPGATKHDEKLPEGQIVWRVGRVHRAASHPDSCLWDRAPEGDVSVQVGRAGCLLGWLRLSPLGEVQPSWGTKPLGEQMGIQRLGRDCSGNWQRVGISG